MDRQTERRAAIKLAKARGHRLGVWHETESGDRRWAFCVNGDCRGRVTISDVSMDVTEIVGRCPA